MANPNTSARVTPEALVPGSSGRGNPLDESTAAWLTEAGQ